MITSFGNAISNRKILPKSSIAIISTFVFLSKFVSPVHMQDFIIKVPAMDHFKSDPSEYIQYLPNIIPLMTSLPISYPQALLRSIYFGCSGNITSSYTNSVYQLVLLNKQKMVQTLKSLFAENMIIQAVSALGPVLLGDYEIFELFGVDGQRIFADQAFADFTKDPPKFLEFEYACSVYSILLKKYKNTDYYNLICDRIKEVSSRTLPLHFNRLLLQLSLSLDDIFKDKTESDSLKSAQLLALGKFISANQDTVDYDKAIDLFIQFENSENDVYCSYVEGFASCVNSFLRYYKGDKHIRVLLNILKKNNKNWVQDMEVSNLISVIDHRIAESMIPALLGIEVDRLLSFSLSPNTKLSEAAMNSLNTITSYKTIGSLLYKISLSNWSDDFVVARRFQLLSILASSFDVEEFKTFIPIAYECILYCESMASISMTFHFLKYIKIDYITPEIREYCFEFLINSYGNFTQIPLYIRNTNRNITCPPSTLLESYDTDIVNHPEIHHKIVLGPTKSCFEFICKIPPEILEDTYTLFWICMAMIPIFDNDALEKAISTNVTLITTDTELWSSVINTFLYTSDNKVAATCCKLFAETKCKIPNEVQIVIEKYLIEQRCTDPDLLLYCFVLIDRNDHEKALSTLPTLQIIIDPITGPPLMFRLCAVLGKSVVKFVIDEFSLSLLMLANNGVSDAKNRVIEYIQDTEFSKWSCTDEKMNFELIDFMKSNKIQKEVKKIQDLDRDHLEFAMLHKDIIIFDGLEKLIEENPLIFYKIKNTPYKTEKVTFSLEKIDKIDKISISKEMKENKLIKNIPLICSFLENTQFVLSNDFMKEILNFILSENDTKSLKICLKYCLKNSISIDRDLILQNDMFMEITVLPMTIKLLNLKISEFPEKIKTKILEISKSDSPYDLLRISDYDLIEALAIVDPDYFNTVLQDVEEFKTKSFKVFSQLLSSSFVTFSGIIINDFISQNLALFISLPTSKHCCVLLRFILAAIVNLRQRKMTMEYNSIVALVIGQLEEIINIDSASVYYEFRHLLYLLVQISNEQKIIFEFLNNFFLKNKCHFLYFNSASYFVTNNKIAIPSMNVTDFIQNLKSGIPSFVSSSLVGATQFIQIDSSINVVTFIVNFVDNLIPLIYEVARNNKTVECLIPFILKLLMSKEKFGNFHPLLMEFTSVFMTFPKSPVFDSSISLLHHLVDIYPSLVEEIFNLSFFSQSLVLEIQDIFEKREKLVYQKTFDLFTRCPSIELGLLLHEFARSLKDEAEFEKRLLILKDKENLQIYVTHAKFCIEKYGIEKAKEIMKQNSPNINIL